MNDVATGEPRAELFRAAPHDLPGRPGVDERRLGPQRGRLQDLLVRTGAEESGPEIPDRLHIPGDGDGTLHPRTRQLVGEMEDVYRAVARERVVIDEDDVHGLASHRGE